MKPILLAVFALTLYALQNVILEQKLSKYNALALLLYFDLAVLPLTLAGLAYLKAVGQEINFPSGWTIVLTLGVGVLYFLGDSSYHI